ncbi:hypothetical protein AT292_25345 [Enterobacter cloacae]|nr:hypothetical protein AT292_25345 [Enterobacter cloacae]
MLRRYAITNTVYQPRQRDVVSLSLISNNQSFSYLHLILRWAAGTEIKAQHVVREAVKTLTHQISKTSNRHRVIFQHDYPARLLGSPFKRASVIPVRAVVTVINQQMSIQQRSKTLCMF